MKVVLDTNVLVSAALKQKSIPGMTPAYSNRSLAERQQFEEVARPYFDALIDPDPRAWLMIRRRLDLNAQLAAFFGLCLWSHEHSRSNDADQRGSCESAAGVDRRPLSESPG